MCSNEAEHFTFSTHLSVLQEKKKDFDDLYVAGTVLQRQRFWVQGTHGLIGLT